MTLQDPPPKTFHGKTGVNGLPAPSGKMFCPMKISRSQRSRGLMNFPSYSSCGGTGTRSRSRNCIGPVDGGRECPTSSETQTESCDAPACWTDFGEWSQCSLSCGGTGTQTRSKSRIEPENGGQACPSENVQEVTFYSSVGYWVLLF